MPNGSDVGVVNARPVLDKAEQSLTSKDSSVDIEKMKPVAPTEGEKELERVKDFNSTDEEVLRLMHPSIVPGEFWTHFLQGELGWGRGERGRGG